MLAFAPAFMPTLTAEGRKKNSFTPNPIKITATTAIA